MVDPEATLMPEARTSSGLPGHKITCRTIPRAFLVVEARNLQIGVPWQRRATFLSEKTKAEWHSFFLAVSTMACAVVIFHL